jgi:hypothetical protein
MLVEVEDQEDVSSVGCGVVSKNKRESKLVSEG